jgi:hypothetical protein
VVAQPPVQLLGLGQQVELGTVDGRSGSDPVAACPRTWMLGVECPQPPVERHARPLQQVVRPAQRLPISKRQSARVGMRMTWSALTCRRRWRSRRVELPALLEDGEVAFGVEAVQPFLVDDRA